MIRFTLLLALCILETATALAQVESPKDIEVRLKSELLGKVIILRNSSTAESIRYKEDGPPIAAGENGTWTLYGFIEIENVSVKKESVVIQGTRRAVICDTNEQHLSQARTKLRARIEIDLGSDGFDEKRVDAAIRKIVVSDDEKLSDFVPDYWKNYLERNPVLSVRGGCGLQGPDFDKQFAGHQPKSSREDAFEINFKKEAGAVAPKLIRRVDPDYKKEARLARYEGTVNLRMIIEADGTVSEVWILQPIGFGLDEEAIRCVQQWRFSPATREGIPLAIYARVDVTFKLQ